MIVLDTNVISELMRREPDERVMAWIGEQPIADMFTTTLTQAEIFYGLPLLPESARRNDLLAAGLWWRILGAVERVLRGYWRELPFNVNILSKSRIFEKFLEVIMSDVEKLIEILTRAKLHFYHFTDTRNLPSIDQRGLLSRRALWEVGIATRTGGNDWSLDADRRSGMDAYVHLCFFSEHPMEWLARQDGRIENSKFLHIDPAILGVPGVLITDGVANKAAMTPLPAEQMIGKLDLKVIYTRTDWKDPQIQIRLKSARLCEILIPRHVPRTMIKNL